MDRWDGMRRLAVRLLRENSTGALEPLALRAVKADAALEDLLSDGYVTLEGEAVRPADKLFAVFDREAAGFDTLTDAATIAGWQRIHGRKGEEGMAKALGWTYRRLRPAMRQEAICGAVMGNLKGVLRRLDKELLLGEDLLLEDAA